MHMMYGYGSIWSMLLMTIFWIGLISFGILLVTKFMTSGDKSTPTPVQILKERLAKGEIDQSEYDHLKSIVEKDEKK